jgi:hypothetical protein
MVYDCQDSVESIAAWELGNQIQSDYLEGHRFRWDRDSVERGLFGVRDRFILLTRCASFDVFRDPVPHARPFVSLRYRVVGLVSSQVSSHK